LIKNKATINENVNATMKILQEEIKKLKDELEISKKAQMDLQNTIIKNTNNNNFNTSKKSSNNNSNICDICLNKKGVVDSQKSSVDIMREKMILEQTKEMNLLIAKIDNLINIQSSLEQKLKSLDDIYLDEFSEKKNKYEINYQNSLINLNEKIKQFNSILPINESIFNELKEMSKNQDKYKNNIDYQKIRNLIEELNNFKYDFELNSYLDIYKLEQENRNLKNELDIYKNISLSLQQNKIYSKVNIEDLNYYNEKIKQFIEVNKEIKEFFKSNLISQKGSKTLKEINLALIDQMSLDKMKFQIEEYKIEEDNKLNQIEELESENFLLNMEIMKYKSSSNQLNLESNDNYIDDIKSDNNIKIYKSERIELEKLEKGLQNTDNNFIDFDDNSDTIKNNNQTSGNDINSLNEKNLNINLNVNSENNNLDRNSYEIKYSAKNNNNNNINENENISIQNKNEKSYHKENLRKSFPEKNSRNSFMGNCSTNSHNTTQKNILSKENMELLKLKEKVNDLLIESEERNSELNLKNSKIQELEIQIENFENNISVKNITIKSLKDEVDTLYDSNNILTMDIEKLNNYQEKLKKNLEIEIREIYKLVQLNDELVFEINEDYKTNMDESNEISSNYFNKSNEMVYKLTNLLSEKSEKLEKTEKAYKELIKLYKENIWDVFENLTFSIKEFEKSILTKINKNEAKLNNFQDHIERAHILLEYKIKKQNSIFQGEIHRKILNILNKVGVLSSKENFDELLEKFEQYISGKIFQYLNIDKNKLTKLERKILDLKEEKRQLNNDIILLRTDFSDALSSMALNNKIALLMKFKEENFKLKIEINQMRKKNDSMEKQFNRILENHHLNNSVQTNFLSVTNQNNSITSNNILNNSKFLIHSENNVNSFLQINPSNSNNNPLLNFPNPNNSFISSSGSSNQNHYNQLEEFSKMKREYNELIEKIFDLDDNENTKTIYSNKNPQKNHKEKQVFRKALEILNKLNENKEYDKFFNKINFKNEMEFQNNILDTIHNTDSNNYQSENNINANLNINQNDNISVLKKLNANENKNINNNKKNVPNNQIVKTNLINGKEDTRNITPIKQKEEKLNSALNNLNKTPKNILNNSQKPTPNNKVNKTFIFEKRESFNNKMLKSQNELVKKNSLK